MIESTKKKKVRVGVLDGKASIIVDEKAVDPHSIGMAVYGSLREGDYNHKHFLSKGEYEMKGKTELKGYRMRSFGAYPAIESVDDQEKTVKIDLFFPKKSTEIEDLFRIFSSVYRMEIGAGYHTDLIEDKDGNIYVLYPMDGNIIRYSDEIVEDGDWIKFKYGEDFDGGKRASN